MVCIDSYDLIIFDWDGTLFDSVSPFYELIFDAEREFPHTRQGKSLKNNGLLCVLHQLLKQDHTIQLNDIKILLNMNGYGLFWKTDLFQGVKYLLSELYRRERKMALVTDRNQAEVLAELQELGIDHYFFAVVGADQGAAKPNPSMLKAILTLAQCAPERALMVGDTALDLEMAILAGMPALATAFTIPLNTASHIAHLLLWRPLMLLRSVSELVAVLLEQDMPKRRRKEE
jgi:phosphoglycolate phosphatase